MMKTAVVTGASGFIGSYLTRFLLSKNYCVYGVGTDIHKLKSMNFEGDFYPVAADFSEYGHLQKIIDADKADIFFHFAWQGGFTTALRDYRLQFINSTAACEALNSAINLKCEKFIFAGTVNEIEINQFINNERFVPRNTNIYASCKVAADMICRTIAHENDIHYSNCLIPLPFGIGNDSRQLINILIKNCYLGQPTKLIKGDNMYDIAHIDDIVRAIYAIGESGKNMRAYYIGHRALKTFKEICTEIRDTINPNAELLFGEYKDSLNMDYSYTDLESLYRDTGFECSTDMRSKIIEQAEWLKSINF
ncbi:MAG: NAD(P)-dependent oxidoreductase [Lachnospiraceae bacterium]|nr:NAD(P)-dependent oxidoreductase [Lachnospiraceae bacterium]